jgi:hypothetical protein
MMSFLFALLAVASLAHAQPECPGIIQNMHRDFSSSGGIAMSWGLDPGAADAEYAFRFTFKNEGQPKFEIEKIWNAEALAISGPHVAGSEASFEIRVKTVSTWDVDLFGFSVKVASEYLGHDLIMCAGVKDEYAPVPFEEFESKAPKALDSLTCEDLMVQSQFHEYSKWGGVTIEYKIDPGMADAVFTVRMYLEKKKDVALSISDQWNTAEQLVDGPQPVPDNPDLVQFDIQLKTEASWAVDVFGFSVAVNSLYVDHEVVDCPVLKKPFGRVVVPDDTQSPPSRG